MRRKWEEKGVDFINCFGFFLYIYLFNINLRVCYVFGIVVGIL